jgi:hypothetical protein
LNLSYLDDLTLGGPEEAIAQDVQRIINVGDSSECKFTSHKLTRRCKEPIV